MFSTHSTTLIQIYRILIVLCLTIIILFNFHRLPINIRQTGLYSHCFQWESIDNRSSPTYECPHYKQINSFIWTYDCTGIMKYIQWIVIRKLGNIKITRLNNNCRIIEENSMSSDSTNKIFIQIYIMSLSVNLTDKSECSTRINKIATTNLQSINHIYFTRKSTKAMIIYQKLDLIKENFNLTKFSLNKSLIETNNIIKRFPEYFKTIRWISIYSENLIKMNLIDCERVLTDFMSLLGINISSLLFRNAIQYDSHQFIEDSTWWDQSEVVERLSTMSIPLRPSNLTYTNDFYYLHGDRSFVQYLSDNRQCSKDGIFTQMQSETISNRTSTDQPDRCLSKPFDCAFSDLYSFSDREEIYQKSNKKPIKCGFTIPSIFDRVRNHYGRNHTCQTIVFTSITNCYDSLPEVKGVILPSFCFVALVDTRTSEAYKRMYKINVNFKWDLIVLGDNATVFSVAAKSAETLKIVGQRMFPLAKWIIWLDGKGHINDIGRLLAQVQAPFIGAHHPDKYRTSESEVHPTINRLRNRERTFPQRLNKSLLDIQIQKTEYKRDGFYARSNALKLKMYDIAVFIYRNNHPCISRYLCGWHNEVNYFSYRGQLSVYYSAVRFNLTNYLHFLPRTFYSTVRHRAVC